MSEIRTAVASMSVLGMVCMVAGKQGQAEVSKKQAIEGGCAWRTLLLCNTTLECMLFSGGNTQ